ncbi:MAG: hypothetical protein Tsb0032_20780 [Kiloniellaceae bacterium]
MGTLLSSFPAFLAATLTALAVAIPPAEAIVTDVSVSPARIKVAAQAPASASITWRVQRKVMEPPLPGSIASPSLRFVIAGEVLQELSLPIRQDVSGLQMNDTLQFRETIRIPESVLYHAQKVGGYLEVQRIFVDSADATSQEGGLMVSLSGGVATELAVQRLELAFADGARSRVVPEGTELRATAEVSTSGVGLLRVQWEVAGPAASVGTPVFRPLALVRQGIGGAGRSLITSPPLPASATGTHHLRLRVLEEEGSYHTPTLQYYVTPKGGLHTAGSERDILSSGPQAGAILTAGTRFSWAALAGTEAYQLAFYAVPAGPAEPLDPARESLATAGQMTAEALPHAAEVVAGVVIRGDQTSTLLDAGTLAHFESGRRYFWRVIALDGKGTIIGASATREIHKP